MHYCLPERDVATSEDVKIRTQKIVMRYTFVFATTKVRPGYHVARESGFESFASRLSVSCNLLCESMLKNPSMILHLLSISLLESYVLAVSSFPGCNVSSTCEKT